MATKRIKNDRGRIEFAEQMCTTYSHSAIKKIIAQSDVHLARIDKPLLVFKVFYFFLFGAIATAFPFLPSYFRQIGFSSSQIQALAWVRPVVRLLSSPVGGILADRCLPKKMMLQFCTFVWLIGTISLAFVEPTSQMCQLISLNDTDLKVINSTEMQTGFFRRRRTAEYLTIQSKLIPKVHKGNLTSGGSESMEVSFGSGTDTVAVLQENEASGSGFIIDSLHPNKRMDEFNNTDTNKTNDFIKILSLHHKSNSNDTPNPNELNFTIRNELRENTSRLYQIFLGAIAIIVFEEIFMCPVMFVADAVLLAKQTEEGSLVVYGYQRVFGSIGYLIFFLITGSLVNDSFRPVCGHMYADYVINFCFYCVLTIITLLVLIKFEGPTRSPDSFPCEMLKSIFHNKHYGSFFASVAFLGFSHIVISSFHTKYLVESNIGHSSSATINAFRLLGEPLAFFVSHKLIAHVGDINMMFASLVLNMFNHFACSFVTSPWHVIPLGFLEGFTFGGSFVACVTYLAKSSPVDYITTVQGFVITLMPKAMYMLAACTIDGVFQSIYWGLGGILGLLIGDNLIHAAGPTIAFRLFTMLAVIFIIVFTFGLRYVNFRDRNYYSVLLNTFNICTDTMDTQPMNNGSESERIPEEFNACEQMTQVTTLENRAKSSQQRNPEIPCDSLSY